MIKYFVTVGLIIVVCTVVVVGVSVQNTIENQIECVLSSEDPLECLRNAVVEIPPVIDSLEIADACDDTDLDCFERLGEEVLMNKLEGNVDKALSGD